MITDIQVRKLLKYLSQGKTLEVAAARAGMDEKTGRKYRDLRQLPSAIKAERRRTWRTRRDPLGEIWGIASSFLETNAGVEAKALFAYLQREHPGHLGGGQLRTFQRRVKNWRAAEGARHEIFFPKKCEPGRLCRASFRDLAKLQVRLGGKPFDHLFYHFVMAHSNWETGSIFLTQDFNSLSEGLQKSLWEVGGVPRCHAADGLAAAAAVAGPDFTRRFQALLDHYRLSDHVGLRASPAEKDAVDRRYCRFEAALDQALILRGHRDFASLQEYEDFIRKLCEQLNRDRGKRLQAERASMHPLPPGKWRER